MSNVEVSGLHIYPVKSLKGITLDRSAVEKRGLRYDRRWMLVDESGQFLTQRSDTKLALIGTSIKPDGLLLTSPCGGSFLVPFCPSGASRIVRVWKDELEAVEVCTEVNNWLSAILELPCSLVYMPDDVVRATNPEFTLPGDMVGFADAYPVLVIGESSLAELNSKLESPLPMNRFRPNIVVIGSAPHEEDSWPGFQIGDVKFRAVKQCARCSVTATDQETGEVGVEPLRTLAKYRLRDQKILFGAYFVPEVEGQVAIGQALDFGRD
jgi:uncharacterized protein